MGCASPSFCTFSSPLKNLPRWKGRYCLLKVSYVLLLAFAIFTGCCEFGRLWFKCVPTHTHWFLCVNTWSPTGGAIWGSYWIFMKLDKLSGYRTLGGPWELQPHPLSHSASGLSPPCDYLQAPTSMSSLLCWAVPSETVSLINLFSLKLPLSGILPHN